MLAPYESPKTPRVNPVNIRSAKICQSSAKLKKQHKRVEVVPNRLSGHIWRGLLPDRKQDGVVRGIYMGNRSHDADFEMVQSAFEAAAITQPNLRLRLVGALREPLKHVPSWLEIMEIPSNVRDYPAFVKWLQSQCHELDFGIAPLADTSFNAYKSYLKVLDYSGLGLPVLASNHAVYKSFKGVSHVTLVNNRLKDWEAAINNILTMKPLDNEARSAIREWVGLHHEVEGTISQYDDMLKQHLSRNSSEAT